MEIAETALNIKRESMDEFLSTLLTEFPCSKDEITKTVDCEIGRIEESLRGKNEIRKRIFGLFLAKYSSCLLQRAAEEGDTSNG